MIFLCSGPSPIRLVNDIGPVKGSSNPDLICGLSAQNAAMVVPANPGSTVSFQWSGGGGQKVRLSIFLFSLLHVTYIYIFHHSGLTTPAPS